MDLDDLNELTEGGAQVKQEQKSNRFDLYIISNLLKSSRCSSQPWFTLCIQCLFNVHSLSIHCLFTVYSLSIQFTFNVHPMYIQYTFNVVKLSIS